MNVNKTESGFPVPVALLFFRRPETTARVFERIRELRPAQLFLIADGPRGGHPDEAELCVRAREVVREIDWDCEVHRDYSETNLGVNARVTSGLDRVFERVEQAIVLEDDCLPHPSFFPFCRELLDKYRDDSRILMISGNHFQTAPTRLGGSYYFSKLFHIWGWATWRRAWLLNRPQLEDWGNVREHGWLHDALRDPEAVRFFTHLFDTMAGGGYQHWDAKWNYSCWLQNGLSIAPQVNLVSNIGFGPGAAHAPSGESELAELPVAEMAFPLVHPPFVIEDTQADQRTMRQQFHLRDAGAQASAAPAASDQEPQTEASGALPPARPRRLRMRRRTLRVRRSRPRRREPARGRAVKRGPIRRRVSRRAKQPSPSARSRRRTGRLRLR